VRARARCGAGAGCLNGRTKWSWKTEDGELTRISTARTRRVVARVWIWLLGRGSVCSGRRMSARSPGSPPRRAIGSLRGAFGRSASGSVCSAVRPPAPLMGRRLRRSNRSLRESYTRFGTGMSAPALDVCARPSIRWRRSPIRRLGSRAVVCGIRSVVSCVGFVSSGPRCAPEFRRRRRSPGSRNRSLPSIRGRP
jgi:hypothetical protein